MATNIPRTTIEILEDDCQSDSVFDSMNPVTSEQIMAKKLQNYEKDVVGLVYLHEYDAEEDEDAEKIAMPVCGIDSNTISVYMCMKCGTKQTTRIEIHRLKCSRCYNKAFNKIRPPKWEKFWAH